MQQTVEVKCALPKDSRVTKERDQSDHATVRLRHLQDTNGKNLSEVPARASPLFLEHGLPLGRWGHSDMCREDTRVVSNGKLRFRLDEKSMPKERPPPLTCHSVKVSCPRRGSKCVGTSRQGKACAVRPFNITKPDRWRWPLVPLTGLVACFRPPKSVGQMKCSSGLGIE